MSTTLLRTLVLVALVARAMGSSGAVKGGGIPAVCTAPKLSWLGGAACDRFQAGICSTVETCPTLCSSLTSSCKFVTSDALTAELANYATKADLANYPTKAELATTLESYVTKTDLNTKLADYVTKAEFNDYHTPLASVVTGDVAPDGTCTAIISGAAVSATCTSNQVSAECPAGYYSAQLSCEWVQGFLSFSFYTPSTNGAKANCRYPDKTTDEGRIYRMILTCMKSGPLA